jgi:hypothetical protein
MRKKVVAAACTAATVLTVTGVAQAQSLNVIPDVVRTLDGSGNNVAHPTWGQTNTQYLRVAPANYADGIKKPVAGPPTRYVSNRIHNDTSQNLFSENNVTQWGFAWGQFMDHTFGLRQEVGGENAPIAFAASDPLEEFTNTLGGGTTMGFTRTPAAPGTGAGNVVRQHINTVSSYIDAFSVYGGTNARLEWLREGPVDGNLSNNGAKLLLAPDGTLPRRTARGNAATAPEMALMGRLMFAPGKAMVAGDVRANENAALAATHTLFAKEHNRIVNALPRSLGEETRFQIARRVVGAEQQYITYTEFLPSLGLTLSPYSGYKPNVNASLGNEFAVVGYRAHSMIHGELEPIAPEGTYTAAQLEAFEDMGIEVEHEDGQVVLVVPLNLAFGNPDLLAKVGVNPILKGLGGEPQYKNDEQIDNQLRSVLFQVPKPGIPDPSVCLDGPPLPDCFQGVTDLGAIDIERGRDHGMPLYNKMRQAYGLAPKSSFTAITGESTDRFPNDPLINRNNPINDPNILDFVELRDIEGNVIDPADEDAVDGAAVEGKRRSTLAARLRAIYGSVDKVDAFVGMVSERHVGGSEFGELQRAIWRKQFEALRDGDRFFYLNDPALPAIRALFGIDYRRTLGQVIEANSNLDVQDDVFEVEPE